MESFLAWLIESSLLVLMIFGIRKIFSGRISHAGIYALWLVVLIRFMIPVNFISTPFSVANLMEKRFALQSEDEPGLTAQGADEKTDEKGQRYIESSTAYTNLAVGETRQDGKMVSEQDVAGAAILPQQETEQIQDRESKDIVGKRYSEWMPVFRRVQVFVSVFLFLWLFVSNIRLLHKMKKNRTLLGKKKTLKIYSTNVVQNPCLYGFLRPAAYLPEYLVPVGEVSTEKQEELEQIVTHEFVHYHHRDHIWAIFRMILVSVYWFNPFTWLAASASKKDAELFCDETVIRLLGEEKRFQYGEMLVRLAGDHSWGDFRYSMMPMSRRGKEMARRIRAISTRKRYSKWVIIPLSFLLLMAVGITGSAGFGPLAKEKGQTEEESESATGAAVSGENKAAAEQETKGQISLYKKPGGQTEEFALANSILFDTNPYIKNKLTGEEPILPTLQNEGKIYQSYDDSYEYLSSGSETPEEAFENYLLLFTDSVNTGNTGELYKVLAEGSKAYEQQSALVKNYFKRGIHEEVKSYSVSSKKEIDENTVEISSKENINVSYADGSSKLIRQKYRYTCKYMEQSWIISGMKAI